MEEIRNCEPSNYPKLAEQLVKNLKKNFNLYIDKKNKLCWSENNSRTGQKVDKLIDAIVSIWNEFELCEVVIELKKRVANTEKRMTHFIVIATDGTEREHLVKIKTIGGGEESKIIKACCPKANLTGVIKVIKTIRQILKTFDIKEKENPEKYQTSYKQFDRSQEYFKKYMYNLWAQEGIINLVNSKGTLSGLISPAKTIAPLIYTMKKGKNPEVTWMRWGDLYNNDAFDLSVEKWPIRKLIKGFHGLFLALKEVHQNKHFLGDIKTSNILINETSKTLTFCDFSGLAYTYSEEYLQLEEYLELLQITEEDLFIKAGQSWDIFAFGASLYEMITGKYLFKDTIKFESYEERRNRIQQGLEEVAGGRLPTIVVKDITEILSSMCHPEKDKRHSAAEAIKYFEEKILPFSTKYL